VERLCAPALSQESGDSLMKVLHVIPSLSPSQGGPSKALPEMARGLAQAGVSVDVACTDDDGTGRRISGVTHGVPVTHADGFRVFYFPKQTEFYKVSLPLLRWLCRHAREYDVVHIHTVFSFSTLAGALAARLARVPYIVRPLGVLNAWGMKNRRRWVKALSFGLLDKPTLNRAAAIHYTSDQEAAEAAPLGLTPPPVVLPLGIDLTSFSSLPPREALAREWPQAEGKMVILFLSRLDEKKGLPVLLEAFEKVHRECPETLLMVAGDGDAALQQSLQQQSKQLGIEPSVIWTGHVSGTRKLAALAGADLFVLPSRSENFGIALLEAMAAGLPCVTTPGVALACDEVCRDAVIRTPVDDADTLARECVRLIKDGSLRHRFSTSARAAAQNYSSEVMAVRLLKLYDQLSSSQTNHA
jgi:glycosyltransferase involved in cell wall biosynthesis